MDRYEYKLKKEQIMKLVAHQDYYTAMQIADTMDFQHEKDYKLLSQLSEVYVENGRYSEAIDLLLQAYEHAPIGRRIIYRLTELALDAGHIDEAEAYFEEFMNVASHDQGKYILRYKIDRAKGQPLSVLIHTLEEYRQLDFDERWAYELAVLYDEAGRKNDCVKLCDEIILWFALGKYVDKAMELKVKYEPLTESQREKRDNKEKYEAQLREVQKEYGKYEGASQTEAPVEIAFASGLEATGEDDAENSAAAGESEPVRLSVENELAVEDLTDGDMTEEEENLIYSNVEELTAYPGEELSLPEGMTEASDENGTGDAESGADEAASFAGDTTVREISTIDDFMIAAENEIPEAYKEEVVSEEDSAAEVSEEVSEAEADMDSQDIADGAEPEAADIGEEPAEDSAEENELLENMRFTEGTVGETVEVTVGNPLAGIKVVPDQERVLSERVQRKTKVLMGEDEDLDTLTQELIWGITEFGEPTEEQPELTPIEELLQDLEAKEQERKLREEEEARRAAEIEAQLQTELAEKIRIEQEQMERRRMEQEEARRLEARRLEEERQFEQFAPEEQLYAIVTSEELRPSAKMTAIASLIESLNLIGDLDSCMERIHHVYGYKEDTPFEPVEKPGMPFGDDEEAEAMIRAELEEEARQADLESRADSEEAAAEETAAAEAFEAASELVPAFEAEHDVENETAAEADAAEFEEVHKASAGVEAETEADLEDDDASDSETAVEAAVEEAAEENVSEEERFAEEQQRLFMEDIANEIKRQMDMEAGEEGVEEAGEEGVEETGEEVAEEAAEDVAEETAEEVEHSPKVGIIDESDIVSVEEEDDEGFRIELDEFDDEFEEEEPETGMEMTEEAEEAQSEYESGSETDSPAEDVDFSENAADAEETEASETGFGEEDEAEKAEPDYGLAEETDADDADETAADAVMEDNAESDDEVEREVHSEEETEDYSYEYEQDQEPVESRYVHLFVKSDKPEAGYRYALDYLKKLSKTQRPEAVAKTNGIKLNMRGIASSSMRMKNRVLVVEQAGQLSQETLEELYRFLRTDGRESMIVLIDSQLAIDKIKKKHPPLAKLVTKELVYVDMSADELVQHAKIYAAEQDCVIDEMGTLALYAIIEHILQTTDGSLLSEVEAIVDEVIEEAERLTPANLFTGLFGSKYNKEGQLILKEKHFEKLKKS